MGKRSTITGYWRQHGDVTRTAAPAVVPCVLHISGLDATVDAGTGTGVFFPKGGIPLRVDVLGQGTGGTTPLIDIGLELSTPDDDGLVDGVDPEANSSTALGSTEDGVLLGTEITELAEVTYGDDGSGTNSTGGTVDIFIWYTFADDGKVND